MFRLMKYFLPALGMMICVPLAWAVPVTFVYDSTTDASAAGGPVSEPVSVVFTFDSSLANGTGDFGIDSQHGSYGPWSGTLTLGTQTVDLNGGTIDLWNNITVGSQTSDGYDFRWDGTGPSSPSITSTGTLFGQQLDFFRILIVDNSATMFSSNALPTNPSFAPHANYFIQDEYDLANGVTLGTTEFNPPGRPYSLTTGTAVSFAVQYWDGRGAANDGKITGGSGTWNTTTANWTAAMGSANGKWTSGAAIFGGTAGTVTLGGPITTTGLTFQTDGYVISGSSALTLAGAVPMLTMNGGATISAPIAGTNGLIVNGPGKLILSSAANRYSGGTTVAGALQIGTATTMGSIGSGPITIGNSATLTLMDLVGYRLSNNVSNGSGGLGTLAVSAPSLTTLSGTLTDGGNGQLALLQNGAGTTIVANASAPDAPPNSGNTYSGGTTITRGTLQVGTAAAGGSLGTGPVTVSGTGTLNLLRVSDSPSPVTTLVSNWSGTLVNMADFSNNIADGVNGTGSVVLDPVSSLTASGVISGAGSVTNVGMNIFGATPIPVAAVSSILTGANTYTGATLVSSGILQIGNGTSGSLASGSAVTVNVWAALALNLPTAATFSNHVTNNGRIALVGANEYTVAGVISGTGYLLKTGTGTAVLTGANTYTGGTTVSVGTLLAANTTGSATGKGPVTVNNGGTLGGGGTISGNVVLNKGGAIAPGVATAGTADTTLHLSSATLNGGSTLTLGLGASTSDALNLSGALTKAGAGPVNIQLLNDGVPTSQLLLSGPTYTLLTFGSTNFSLSNFSLIFPSGLTGTLVETKTSLLLENVGPQLTTTGGTGGLIINGSIGGGTLTLNGQGGTLVGTGTLGGSITYSGSGGFIIGNGGISGGTLTLTSGSTYLTGLTGYTGGVISGSGAVIGSTFTGTGSSGATLNVGDGGIIDAGDGGSLSVSAGIDESTFGDYTGATITAAAPYINAAGMGTVTLAANNTYGNLVVQNGISAPVPEPGSALLVLLGGSVFLGRRRRVGGARTVQAGRR